MDLTPKPSVPLLVRAAMAGALAATPLGCGDDGGGDDANSSDVAPTAGPCYHTPGVDPIQCEMESETLDMPTGGETATGTGGMTATTTATTADTAPTAGPCFHADGGMLPECMTTGPEDSTGGSDSGTGGATDSGTGGSGSGTTGGG